MPTICLLCLCAPRPGFPQEDSYAVPLDGPPFAAALVEIDSAWQVTFRVAGQPRTIPASTLAYWGAYGDSRSGPLVLLADGAALAADVMEISEEHLIVESELWRWTRLPRSLVRGVIFQSPREPLARDRLVQRVQAERGTEDRVRLANGDEITGRVMGPVTDTGSRNLFGLPSIRVQRAQQANPIPIDVEDVVAVTFDPSRASAAAPREVFGHLGLRDGSVLQVSHLAREGGNARLTLCGGALLTTDANRLWDSVTLLQPQNSHVRYVSDLEPIGYKHIPFLTWTWPYGVDRNVLGGRLRSGGRVWLKGLGMHSTSRLAYDLGGRYRAFQAELALDDRAGLRGSVVYRVFLDRVEGAQATGTWKVAYESPVIRGGQAPLPISVDVTGAARMALIVDFADRGDELDDANWLNARLLPQRTY